MMLGDRRVVSSFTVSNMCSEPRVGLDGPIRLVTVIVGVVVGSTFLFCLGNVATLGIRLGVSTYVAVLVSRCMDSSRSWACARCQVPAQALGVLVA
ncbi:putative membrane protein [Candidatus Protofrankia californiensis]|uniref:Putative membrane protein n=1 Tax=Candidatus Protofrankia californiensis TaxID=1839754 RepID=A0A1C3PG71_9ACTN|nr:putative membrane protein [Candidatus Protofrankia californiensis]